MQLVEHLNRHSLDDRRLDSSIRALWPVWHSAYRCSPLSCAGAAGACASPIALGSAMGDVQRAQEIAAIIGESVKMETDGAGMSA
jgi:hypothetical protein